HTELIIAPINAPGAKHVARPTLPDKADRRGFRQAGRARTSSGCNEISVTPETASAPRGESSNGAIVASASNLPGSQQTRCWRERDSNRRSLSQNESVSPPEREVPQRRKGLSRERRLSCGEQQGRCR